MAFDPFMTPDSGGSLADIAAQFTDPKTGQIDVAALEEFMSSGMFDEKQALLGKQQALAESLRRTPKPEGRQAGGVYVASNPLEFLGTGLAQYKGEQDLKGLIGKNEQLIRDTQKGGAAAFARMLSMYLRQTGADGLPASGATMTGAEWD